MKNLQEYLFESLKGSFDISYILPAIQIKLDEYLKYLGRKYPELKDLHTESLEQALRKCVDEDDDARGRNIGNPISPVLWLKTDMMSDNISKKVGDEGLKTFNEKIDVGTLKISFRPDVPAKWDSTNRIVDIFISFDYKPNAKGKKIGSQQGTGMHDYLNREITVGANVLCTNIKYQGSLMRGIVKSIGPEKITIDAEGERVIVYPDQCAVLTSDMLK